MSAEQDWTICQFTGKPHAFETNEDDGPDYDFCTDCRIYRHETR